MTTSATETASFHRQAKVGHGYLFVNPDASIVAATSLLSSTLTAPISGFSPLWFRNELIGAVSEAWLPRLDSRLFKLDDEEAGGQPVVRIRGGDRRSESGLVPAHTLNRWFAQWAQDLHAQGLLPGWRGETCHLYGTNETVDNTGLVLHRERATLYDLKVPLVFQPVLSDGESSEAMHLSPERLPDSLATQAWCNEGAWATRDLLLRYGVPVAVQSE